MTLSKTERLTLANQYRILAVIDQLNARSYERYVEALESGYESAIADLFDPIFDGLNTDACSFVINVMAMHDALQRSQTALGEASTATTNDVKFRGFDGNNETEYMAYARFVVQHEQRFTYLEPIGGDFNSHMASLSRYRPMLAAWIDIGEKYNMSDGEMQQVLSAR
jgi:uncharacterized protein